VPEAGSARAPRGRSALWAGALVIVLAIAAVVWIGSRSPGDDGRLAEVAARGARVMPFDLERTTHRFEPRSDGGVQTVVADDPGDSDQIHLIRRHLADEAERFKAGDFGDPATIHGDEMPGLAELKEGVGRIEVRYEDAPAGGRISYRTENTDLVAAIHDWFEAQLTDHGPHAEQSPSS
jgi:hypothetical protein